jgi:phosphatidylserine/phosphatidylglycerophosphate/cardiolipin synthase-like enzyme
MIAALPAFLRRPAQPILPGLAMVLCLTLVVLGIGSSVYMNERAAAETKASEETRAVHFTPGEQPTTAVVEALNAATQTVHVQAYSFTSAPIAKALVEARQRGVDVTAILDKSQKTANYSSADFLAHEGVPTFIDAKHAIAHNKIMIIDGETVITGSFNFTKAAQESNAENLLVLRDRSLADKYERNWQTHFAHSQPYAGR